MGSPDKRPLLRRTTVLLWFGCELIVLTPWLGLQFGATDLSWQQVLAGLLGEGSSHVERVVMHMTGVEGLTVIMSLHDLNQAAQFADYVLVLEDGQLWTAMDFHRHMHER